MEATAWALVPPILAIVISLITKEVNISLIVGILFGAGLYTGFHPFTTVTTTFDVMQSRVGENMYVLFFIILLGMIVHLMNLSGATREYAKWASEKLKTKKLALFATMILGIVIFIDDYFNCLTVGTVMRPITDRNKVSREKLAYVIDSTAAPICILAPISSWAAAVSSSLPKDSSIDGFQLFIKTIFCNYYSWFSLLMVVIVIVFSMDFGKMRKFEQLAEAGTYEYEEGREQVPQGNKGKVIDLILPVLVIILFCVIGMLYTGGVFEKGVSVAQAFANCDAIVGLTLGAAYTIVFLAILYLPRKVVTPKQFIDGLVEGFLHMVPATLILTFAWTLSGICGADYLNAGGFVAAMVSHYQISLVMMPAIFFVVGLFLAFATGTSWGTFAILLPIIVSVFGQESSLMILTTSAILGGSVCGDHISPISDTTILSSTGAGCHHINHVSTQLQYGITVAAISFVCYMIAAFTENTGLGFVVGLVLMALVVLVQKKIQK